MNVFKYHAKITADEYRDGTIEARNENDAVNKLVEQGLCVISIKKVLEEDKREELNTQPKGELVPEDKKRIYEEEKYRLEVREKIKKGIEKDKIKQILGLIGSIVLFIGVFVPILHVPLLGDLNYFQNGKGDGIIIIFLAIVSLMASLNKNFNVLWFSGLGSLGLLFFTFMNIYQKVNDIKLQMDEKLAGNPFRAIGDLTVQSLQIQWGWGLLVIGALLVVVAAGIKKQKRYGIVSCL